MQKFVTPQPGRTTRTRIVNREDYQLDVKVSRIIGAQWRLEILRYIPESDWVKTELYLTDDELERFRQAIDAGR